MKSRARPDFHPAKDAVQPVCCGFCHIRKIAGSSVASFSAYGEHNSMNKRPPAPVWLGPWKSASVRLRTHPTAGPAFGPTRPGTSCGRRRFAPGRRFGKADATALIVILLRRFGAVVQPCWTLMRRSVKFRSCQHNSPAAPGLNEVPSTPAATTMGCNCRGESFRGAWSRTGRGERVAHRRLMQMSHHLLSEQPGRR